MGDILHAMPAVTALRQAHPAWEIDWVVEPAWTALLSARNGQTRPDRGPDQPLVDRIIPAPTKSWSRKPFSSQTLNEIFALRATLRAGRYDAAVDLQGAVRSAVMGWTSGAKRRVGEATPREWAARWLFTDKVATAGAHVIDQDVEVASAIAGDALQPVQPWLPVDAGAERWFRGIVSEERRPMALLNPGAGWGAKRWPVARYAKVAMELARRGFQVLVNAGPNEERLAEDIRYLSTGVAQPVRCSLAELIALTRRAAVVIAGDTGPLHLACALGRPVVGIYGPTDPARNGPYGSRSKVLRSPLSVRDHSRIHKTEAGLLTITAEDVIRATDELMTQETPQ